jgi:RNA polymerase sigma factor (sigma-70 family)
MRRGSLTEIAAVSFDKGDLRSGAEAVALDPRPLDAGRRRLDHAMEAHYEDLLAAIRRRGADPGQAADVVHDLYVRLSRKPETLAGKSSLRAFLIRAAVNLGIDRARRHAFEARLFALLDAHADTLPAAGHAAETQPEAAIDVPRRVAALQRAILELPPQRRAVFVAWRVAGMDKDEIADSMGVTRGMVNRHLRKALVHCMDRLEEIDGT